METDIEQGIRVRISPNEFSPPEFIEKLADMEGKTAYVGAVSSIGVCTLILPLDVVVEGYSKPITQEAGERQHYLDIHKNQLIRA